MKDEDLTCLPTVKVSDIDQSIASTKLDHLDLGNLSVYHCLYITACISPPVYHCMSHLE